MSEPNPADVSLNVKKHNIECGLIFPYELDGIKMGILVAKLEGENRLTCFVGCLVETEKTNDAEKTHDPN